MAEARALLMDGAALVATIDHMHHGIGYGMDVAASRDAAQPATVAWARERIAGALSAAGRGDVADLRARCRADRSDGCDVALALAHLAPGPWRLDLLEVELAAYAPTMRADEPTWVAAALVRIVCGVSGVSGVGVADVADVARG